MSAAAAAAASRSGAANSSGSGGRGKRTCAGRWSTWLRQRWGPVGAHCELASALVAKEGGGPRGLLFAGGGCDELRRQSPPSADHARSISPPRSPPPAIHPAAHPWRRAGGSRRCGGCGCERAAPPRLAAHGGKSDGPCRDVAFG